MKTTLYMVTMAEKPMACGTLRDCWRYVVEFFGRDRNIVELLNMDITIEPAPSTMKPGFVEVR